MPIENTLNQPNPNDFSANAEEARALAGLFNFMAVIFNQRPDIQLVQRLRTLSFDTFIDLQEGSETEDHHQGVQLIQDFIDATRNLPEDQVEEQLAVDWTRLFRGVSPGYGPLPPYEGVYAKGGPGEIELLKRLSRIYAESGVEVGDDIHNRQDYLGLELAFVGYLTEQEAAAWEAKNPDEANALSGKAGLFFQQHIGRWAESFFNAALEHARTDFFKGFILLSRGTLSQGLAGFDSE